MKLWVIVGLTAVAMGQSNITSGQCSPIANSNSGSITINCPGLSAAQGAELLKIVNKILLNQKDLKDFADKLDEILRGVNDIRKASANRHLSEEQKKSLTTALGSFQGEKATITVVDGNPEAYGYALDFASVFQAAGIPLTVFSAGADKTGVNSVTMSGGPPISGVDLQPKDETAWKTPLVQVFDRALLAVKVPHTAHYMGALSETNLTIYIGPRAGE